MRAIIFANGNFTHPPEFKPDDLIIAADGGARHCLALGIIPNLVIGDFDSLDDEQIHQLEIAGAILIHYPVRKDFTDLELALQHAKTNGAQEVMVLAALGGRWDQTLANMLLTASERFAQAHIRLLDDTQELHLLRAGQVFTLNGQPGDTVSLIPLFGDAHGITTHNLEYPLKNETLLFGSTRGISNVLLAENATVSVQDGMLMCVIIHHSDNLSPKNAREISPRKKVAPKQRRMRYLTQRRKKCKTNSV